MKPLSNHLCTFLAHWAYVKFLVPFFSNPGCSFTTNDGWRTLHLTFITTVLSFCHSRMSLHAAVLYTLSCFVLIVIILHNKTYYYILLCTSWIFKLSLDYYTIIIIIMNSLWNLIRSSYRFVAQGTVKSTKMILKLFVVSSLYLLLCAGQCVSEGCGSYPSKDPCLPGGVWDTVLNR